MCAFERGISFHAKKNDMHKEVCSIYLPLCSILGFSLSSKTLLRHSTYMTVNQANRNFQVVVEKLNVYLEPVV